MSQWKASLHLHQHKDCLCYEMFCFLSNEQKWKVCSQNLVIASHLHSYGKTLNLQNQSTHTQRKQKPKHTLIWVLNKIRSSCTECRRRPCFQTVLPLLSLWMFCLFYLGMFLHPSNQKTRMLLSVVETLWKLPLTKALSTEVESVPRCCNVAAYCS